MTTANNKTYPETAIPLILGHRGAPLETPENTLPSFLRAIELGVDGIELDVLVSSDGVPVVTHNDNLDRFTTTYSDVHETPLKSIKTIDAGRRFDPKFKGTPIPTLREALEVLSPSGILINIEIKSQPVWNTGVEKKVIDLINEFEIKDRVVVSSFSPMILWRMRHYAPEIKRGLLMGLKSFFFLHIHFFATLLTVSNIHPIFTKMTPLLVTTAHKRGWDVITWTVNTPEQIASAVKMGVNAFITDDPGNARTLMNVLNKERPE